MGFMCLFCCNASNSNNTMGRTMCIKRESTVEEAKNESTYQYFQLPYEVIQHIISFLPLKDAIATRILSKTWQRISPVQHLNFSTGCSHLNTLNNDGQYTSFGGLKEDFLHFVDQSLKMFYQKQKSVLTFSLYVNEYAAHSKQLTVLSLVTCELKDYSVGDAARLDSLHDLSLDHVHLSDRILNQLISISPNIKQFSLKLCEGINFLELLNLDRLEKVVVQDDWIYKIKIESRSLHTFDFHRRFHKDCEIDLKCRKNLEVLRLDTVIVPRLFSENLFSDFPLIKSLFLFGQHKLRKFKISSPRLELLHLYFVENLVDATIDAPNLRSFKYTANEFLPFLFQMNTLHLQKTSFRLYSFKIDVSWFLKLREFVGKHSHNEALSLHFPASLKLTFNLGELRGIPIPPVRGVKHLKLKLLNDYSPPAFEPLVDGILWSCYPEMLTMELGTKKNKFIEVLKAELQHTKNEKNSCCESTDIKCWRHDLKDFETEQFIGTKKRKPQVQRKMISFRFKW
ncbi:hypothetical protein ACSBR1_043514 [Camellia fascicularis]